MSDALCGPSNPLQQFKQQTQLDRTLQQDRLASRASPSQGFRSANQNAGMLDPEFEAFQAGLPAPELPQFNHLQRPPAFAGPSSQPSWASDFQQLHISSPPAQQNIRPGFQGYSPQYSEQWRRDFAGYNAQTAPKAQQAAPSPQAFQYMARYGMNGYQNHFAQPSFAPIVQSKGKEVATEQWDDDAFARVFDQVSDALVAEQETMDVDVEREAYVNGTSASYQRGASTGNAVETDTVQGTEFQSQQTLDELAQPDVLERLENDPIADELLREDLDSAMDSSVSEQQKQQEDDDALAATAQELLEKVEHNKTDKFKNSQFLSLMRKLRDREMKVEGNDMVETNAAASATTESASASAVSDLPRFNNSEQTPQAINDPVDWAPPDMTSRIIPPHEQDHDNGRFDPRDGQAVVDLLSQPLPSEMDDIGTSVAAVEPAPPARDLLQGVFYGDLRARKDTGALPSPMEVAYGVEAAFAQPIDWRRWDLQSPGYRSHRSAQPAPGLH